MSREIPQARTPEVPLNNLDLLDPRGVGDLYDQEILWDDPLDMQTDALALDLDPDEVPVDYEEYEGYSSEELRKLAVNNFYGGKNAYSKSLPRPIAMPQLRRLGIDSPENIVLNTLRFFNLRTRTELATLSPYTTIMDRVQNGNLYLVREVNKYDPNRGKSLIAMLNPHYNMTVKETEKGVAAHGSQHAISEGPLMRIPSNQNLRAYYRVEERKRRLSARFGREIEDEELQQFGGISDEELQTYQELHTEHSPFHVLVEAEDRDEGVDFGDEHFVDDDQLVNPFEVATLGMTDTVEQVLSLLNEQERKIIIESLGLNGDAPKSNAQIGRELGLSRERIGKVSRKALDKLEFTPQIRRLIEGEVTLFDAIVIGENVEQAA